MAANDARAFPEYGVAQLVYGTFSLVTTGKESAGALTALAASVSKDGGAYVACTNAPVQQGTTGMVSVLLTATEMTGYHVQVKFTSSLANTIDVIKEVYPAVWTSKAGRGQSRFEELIRKVAEFAINQCSQSGAALSVYCDDGATVSVSGNFTPGDTTATRGALT